MVDSENLAKTLLPALDALVELLADRVAARLQESRPNTAPPSPMLTKRALATALDVSTATIDRMVEDGRIPFFVVGESKRFDLAEVRAAIRAPAPEPKPNLRLVEPAPKPRAVWAGRRKKIAPL